MDSVSDEEFERKPVDFIAEVTYVRTQDGGRKGCAASGYRPLIQINGQEERASAELIFLGQDKVEPGESAKAEIRIIWTTPFENKLEKGTKFTLSEGAAIVASGRVLEVTNPELRKNTSNTA